MLFGRFAPARKRVQGTSGRPGIHPRQPGFIHSGVLTPEVCCPPIPPVAPVPITFPATPRVPPVPRIWGPGIHRFLANAASRTHSPAPLALPRSRSQKSQRTCRHNFPDYWTISSQLVAIRSQLRVRHRSATPNSVILNGVKDPRLHLGVSKWRHFSAVHDSETSGITVLFDRAQSRTLNAMRSFRLRPRDLQWEHTSHRGFPKECKTESSARFGFSAGACHARQSAGL